MTLANSPRRSLRAASAEVTALVGHEISTPIATALLYIRIAECHCASAAGSPNGLARSALGVARSEVQKLKRLVDRVIEIERLGCAVVRPQEVDLGAVVRGTVERALGAVADAVLCEAVTVNVPSGFVGWWDDAAVEQIVRNLLSNALKFGEGRSIGVAVAPTPEGARIVVRDEGIGLRSIDRERIFNRHSRAAVGEGGGLGLGLWLVRELAIAHGGRVAVQSRPGQGATFSVFLPELSPSSPLGAEGLRPSGGARRGPRRAVPESHRGVREGARGSRAGRREPRSGRHATV